MTVSRFDRVRPRTALPDAGSSHDLQGKRALFSSTESGPDSAARAGGIEIECSRCRQTTVLAVTAALRLLFPAVHLGLGVRRGGREATLALLRRRYPSWLRCPACGHGSWVRVTIKI